MRAVLAGTGPLYAAADPNDSFHERSVEEQGIIKSRGLRTIVSYSTLQETHDLALRKLAQGRARALLRELSITAVFLRPTEEDYQKAIRRTLRYPDQNISLADAALAEISDRLEIPVWTFDHHFDVVGVRVWRET